MIDNTDTSKNNAISYLNEIIELSKVFSNAGQEAEFNAIQDIIKKVIDIQNAPVANCGNCIHWSAERREGLRADFMANCLLSKHGKSRIMGSGCGLHTTKDFYCNQHKLKQPKPKNEKPTIDA